MCACDAMVAATSAMRKRRSDRAEISHNSSGPVRSAHKQRTERDACIPLPREGDTGIPASAVTIVPSVNLTPPPSFRLDGKRALVTGGGRGVGLAAASALAQAGAHVTLAARTRDEIEAAAQAIRARGDKAEPLQLDVTDLDAVRSTIAMAEPFDVLVNNAGTNRPAALMDVKIE